MGCSCVVVMPMYCKCVLLVEPILFFCRKSSCFHWVSRLAPSGVPVLAWWATGRRDVEMDLSNIWTCTTAPMGHEVAWPIEMSPERHMSHDNCRERFHMIIARVRSTLYCVTFGRLPLRVVHSHCVHLCGDCHNLSSKTHLYKVH